MNQPADAAKGEGEGWTTVTKYDKKRVMRKGRGAARKHQINAVAHPTASLDGVIGDEDALLAVLAACRNQLQNTFFFKHCMQQLQKVELSLQSQTNTTYTGGGGGGGDGGDDLVNQDPQTTRPSAFWVEILCLGIGNYGRTDCCEYSASLWQLAFALQLRDELQNDVPLYHHDCHPPQNRSIAINFFDPNSTDFEVNFLTQQFAGIHVLDNNLHGKHQIDKTRPTVVFMPHCPTFLYENMLATNSVSGRPSQSPTFCIIGNSLVNYCDALQTAVDIPNIHAMCDSLQEFRLQYTAQDETISSGNFLGAFNDTYLTFITQS